MEEPESVLPKVNLGRDAGDTPGRKNNQEEAKFNTSSPPAHT
jgi:hypothetical protein